MIGFITFILSCMTVIPAAVFTSCAVLCVNSAGRLDRERTIVCIALGATFPVLAVSLLVNAATFLPHVYTPIFLFKPPAGVLGLAPILVCSIVTAVTLRWLTQSRHVANAALGAGLLASSLLIGEEIIPGGNEFRLMFIVFAAIVVWNAVTIIALTSWGRRNGLHVIDGRCAQCHYDLAGLDATVCPECGASLREADTIDAEVR